MIDALIRSPRRVLEPIERVSEILFGLIMVLTFTLSLSVTEAADDSVNTMLIAALGCNLAWGIIDGVLYLMSCLAERGRNLRTLRAVRQSSNPDEAHRIIAGALPPLVASVLQPAELETLHRRLSELPQPATGPRLQKNDWLGATAVFLLVFASTFPVVLPFVFMHDLPQALRVSNAIAIGLLFFTGYVFGRSAERNAWVMGVSMVLLGSALVGLTIALGG